MLKKSRVLAIGLLMSVSTLFAANQLPPKTDVNLYSGGFVTGVGVTTLEGILLFGGNAGAVFEVGYYSPCWMFDIGFNIIKDPRSNAFMTFALGHLGLRNRIYQNLFVSYGLMGLRHIGHITGVTSNGASSDWSVGVFTGLDYQFSKHFILSGKIYPYNYDHRLLRFANNIFANGTISLLYVY